MKVTVTDIINYMYCPRYIYFQYVIGIIQFEEKYAGVRKGRIIHEEKKKINKSYLRKKLEVKTKHISHYIATDYMVGIPDEIYEYFDGTMGCLDYKFSFEPENKQLYNTIKWQLVAYAVMIEETFKKKVNKCHVVFVRSKNKVVTLPVSENDKFKVKTIVQSIIKIVENNHYPEVKNQTKKCLRCTYRNICDEGLRQI